MARNPFFFLLGCQHSGTTLLQHIIDMHPQISVMGENGWFGTWYEQGTGLTPEGFITPTFLATLLRTKNLGISEEEIREIKDLRYNDFISSLFDRHGASRSKSLVGSKNPDYLRHLNTLKNLWPQAKFIHIIRDGRNVWLCTRDRLFRHRKHWKERPAFPFELYEPPDQIFKVWNQNAVMTTALWWEWNVRLGREFGRAIGPDMYHEIHYEDLVRAPEAEVPALCAFLSVPFDSAMLRHNETFKPRLRANGTIVRKDIRVQLPITPGLRDWSEQMETDELKDFEAMSGPFLKELGYVEGLKRMESSDIREALRVRELFERIVRLRADLYPHVLQKEEYLAGCGN